MLENCLRCRQRRTVRDGDGNRTCNCAPKEFCSLRRLATTKRHSACEFSDEPLLLGGKRCAGRFVRHRYPQRLPRTITCVALREGRRRRTSSATTSTRGSVDANEGGFAPALANAASVARGSTRRHPM